MRRRTSKGGLIHRRHTSSLEQDREQTILCLDEDKDRAKSIATALANCGLKLALSKGASHVRHTATGCAIVLVPLEPEAAAGSALIDRFRRDGFQVLAYANGLYGWPVGKRCLPLLAGARQVLDSAAPTFTEELCEALLATTHSIAAEREEEERLQEAMAKFGVVGGSSAMLAIFATVLRISRLSDLPVLITGETGTGKELLARAIHGLDSKRAHAPFIATNAGAISCALAESEFFGHRRGAFTGADRDRKGLIRAADGGILFLDEIGELDLALQEKLLRVLQEGRVLAVGEETETSVDVRVLAATNCHLPRLVEEGKFRADLFHRLNVFGIHIPPLRERLADLRPLVLHFVNKHASLAPEPLEVGDEFIEALGLMNLPGNIRQLENLIRQAMIRRALRGRLTLSDLPQTVWRELSDQMNAGPNEPHLSAESAPPPPAAMLTAMFADHGWQLSNCMDCCEKVLIQSALERSQGNQSATARLLGITSRSVYNKLRKHGLRL